MTRFATLAILSSLVLKLRRTTWCCGFAAARAATARAGAREGARAPTRPEVPGAAEQTFGGCQEIGIFLSKVGFGKEFLAKPNFLVKNTYLLYEFQKYQNLLGGVKRP